MGTITQEIDRINGGKNSIIESTNAKLEAQGSQPIPADTKIDEISPYIDAIQQGGEENAFLTEGNLSYMFDYKHSKDEKIMSGINRMKNNVITSLDYCFNYFKNDINSVDPSKVNLVFEYIEYMLKNNLNVSRSYMLGNFNVTSNRIYDIGIDLRNIELSNSVYNMFNGFTVTPSISNSKNFILKIDKNTFKNCTNLQGLFQSIGNYVYIMLVDKRMNFTASTWGLFQSSKARLIDENNDYITELTLDYNGVENNTLGYLFYSYNYLERIHFLNNNHCTNFSNAFTADYQLKSIDGLDFSNITSSSSLGLFSTSGSNHYTNFGELGIINGSTLGTADNVNLNLTRIWKADKSTIRDGQTIEYWYEKFANALGNKAVTGTQTITISSALYNSLTQVQIELITNKGYVLASA